MALIANGSLFAPAAESKLEIATHDVNVDGMLCEMLERVRSVRIERGARLVRGELECGMEERDNKDEHGSRRRG